jgi:AmiR/NasT family two-component response regulator
MRSESNSSLDNECNLLANTSHHMESQPIVESVTKDQIIDSKETSKRKCSETDAYSDLRLNVMSKKPKLSSITPKIRWRNK